MNGEASAVDEFFEGVIVIAAGVGNDGRNGSQFEVSAGERFGDMDRARLSIGVSASPVVQAESEVALLLNFSEYDSWSECMYGASGYEDAVSGVYFVDMEQVFEVTATESHLEHTGSDTGFQSGADTCAGISVEDDPCFGFAVFDGVERFGLEVVGVYLQGEPIIGIEEFDEQWELVLVLMFSEKFAGELPDDIGECHAFEGAIGNEAGTIGVVSDFPAFGVVGFGADLSSEEGLEFAAAPADTFEDWVEGERRQK